MAIAISLTPELEARLLEKATQQGKDISLVAAELLKNILDWELEDSQAAIQGIQQGLDDFEAGRFRSFDNFANEQRRKYNLPREGGFFCLNQDIQDLRIYRMWLFI